MSTLIPIESTDPYFDLQTPLLDGVTYTLQFRWNVRLGAWFMDILDAQGTTQLAMGLRLVVNFPLASYSAGRQPPGAFVAVDTSGVGTDPGIDELGGRVHLLYFSKAELGL